MYQMYITKENIQDAAYKCLAAYYYDARYSADILRGICLAFSALAETAPMGSELSLLFMAAAKSIPVSRKRSKYDSPVVELCKRFGEIQ